MKVLIHDPSPEGVVRELIVQESDTVAAVLVQLGAENEAMLWVEETEDPLDPNVTILEAGIVDFTHLHHGRCRKVEVSVRFGGESKSREFSPAATVQRIFEWSVGEHGYDLPRDQRPKHTLGLCGSESEADRRAHVGSLATDCRVCFDLAPKTRYQG